MIAAAIHHVTAITADAKRNLAFYRDTLGLRFIKRTVNFDDPTTYHLYYGDAVGSPGTALTFFPAPGAAPGMAGQAFVKETSFAIPESAVAFWLDRLAQTQTPHEMPSKRFGETVIPFQDPDGMALALVARPKMDELPGWSGGPVPAAQMIRGFDGIRIETRKLAPTSRLVGDVFGFVAKGEDGGFLRHEVASQSPLGTRVDVRHADGLPMGRIGRGSVHHVAFRAVDDAEQQRMAEALESRHGIRPTPQQNRKYFRSIYFREPSGVLFEIATDQPGFTVDETAETLGTRLMLPEWYEPQRAAIEAALPDLG